MKQENTMKEQFQKTAKRQKPQGLAARVTTANIAFAQAQLKGLPAGDRKRPKLETAAKRAQRLAAEKKLKRLATTGLAQSAGSISQLRSEIRDLYAAAGEPAVKGSKLDQRIERAAKRAHYVSAEKKLGSFAPGSAHHNTGTSKFFEAEVREHYAASGHIVARGSRLDDRIETAVRRKAGVTAPMPA